MSDKNLVVLKKILEEMSIAHSLLGMHDVDSFMEDEVASEVNSTSRSTSLLSVARFCAYEPKSSMRSTG